MSAQSHLDESQLAERRLEIENRIRNLYWTVAGDYSLNFEPDLNLFAASESLALYDAVRQGAFASHYSLQELALYVLKKTSFGADEELLIDLIKLCIDSAVYPFAAEDRAGVADLRRRAFSDYLNLNFTDSKLSSPQMRLLGLRRAYMNNVLYPAEQISAEWQEPLIRLKSIAAAEDTAVIFSAADDLYRNYFMDAGGGSETLQQVLSLGYDEAVEHRHIALTDKQLQKVMDEYMRILKQEMLRIKMPQVSVNFSSDKPEDMEADDETPDSVKAEKLRAYVERSFGKTFLTPNEQESINRQFCRGLHRNCTLYYTRGILINPAMKNTMYLRGQLQECKNDVYIRGKKFSIRRNITALSAMLSRVRIMLDDTDSARSDYGQINPARLWRVGRSTDAKLFDLTRKRASSSFVVDILLDGSSSQNIRQPQIAAQAYIISCALSNAGIPHRVSSFCSYWDYTIIHRYRDYDESSDEDRNVLQYYAFGDNRDGLAVRAVTSVLEARPEQKKILIILSDGKPNNMCHKHPGSRKPRIYTGEEAIRDTALEVRRARNQGIAVLGIFVGKEEDIYTEKRIFGKEFVYTRSITSFAHIAGNYLCRMMEQDGE